MGGNVLQRLQQKWRAEAIPSAMPEPVADTQPGSASTSTPDEPRPHSPEHQPAGEAQARVASAIFERDVDRIREIMRQYPIRPHLHEAGGAGFSHPYADGWPAENWEIISEFSDLWLSPAGEEIIARYGHLMRVIPYADYRKPVLVQPWRAISGADVDAAQMREASP